MKLRHCAALFTTHEGYNHETDFTSPRHRVMRYQMHSHSCGGLLRVHRVWLMGSTQGLLAPCTAATVGAIDRLEEVAMASDYDYWRTTEPEHDREAWGQCDPDDPLPGCEMECICEVKRAIYGGQEGYEAACAMDKRIEGQEDDNQS
jgi:hypothetical protein